MTRRLSDAMGGIAGVHSVLRDDGPFSFVGDFLHWIIHLIHTVWHKLAHFVTHIYKNSVEQLVDACNDNSTCSHVAKKIEHVVEDVKDFAVDFFEQLKEQIGFRSLLLCAIIIVVLVICSSTFRGSIVSCFSGVYVWVVRCCGFRQRGITTRTPAASYMASYGGYVLANSSCANLQRVGATGAVYHGYDNPVVDDDFAESESGSCCKVLFLFAVVAAVLYFALL